MNYGIKLKELRERIGLNFVEMGNILNISDSLYSRYEKEKQSIPLKHLNTLCNYFNVSIDYIFDFTNTKQYNNSKNEIDLILSGERLKMFRKSQKYTQEKLAILLNVARTIISKYEKGEFIIATHSLYTICKNYNISADYLLGKIDNPQILNK